ncbi:MAG: hypothetical protein H7833_13080 [Magnetococcus sp. DMHC-1]|nr:hypothetical protein [Magnetococcales bacterium]
MQTDNEQEIAHFGSATHAATFGNTRIYASLSKNPWDLKCNAIVMPAGYDGSYVGSFARSFLATLERHERNKVTNHIDEEKNNFGISKPIVINFDYNNIQYIIFATAQDTIRRFQYDVCTKSILNIANKYEISSILLPLIGSGDAGKDPFETANEFINNLKNQLNADIPHLKSIIINTMSQQVHEYIINYLLKLTEHPNNLDSKTNRKSSLDIAKEAVAPAYFLPELEKIFIIADHLAPTRTSNHFNVSSKLMLFSFLKFAEIYGESSPISKIFSVIYKYINKTNPSLDMDNRYFSSSVEFNGTELKKAPRCFTWVERNPAGYQ